MDVTRSNIEPDEVFSQFLCHSFGKRGYQNALLFVDGIFNFIQKIINLIYTGPYLNYWVK